MLPVLSIGAGARLGILPPLGSHPIGQLRYREVLREQIIYLSRSLHCTRASSLCNLCHCSPREWQSHPEGPWLVCCHTSPPRSDTDFYLDRYGEQGREALVQSTNRLLLEHVIRYCLYGSVGSLGLVLRRCEKQRLELLYTVVKDTELLPPWNESRLIKEIEHAIVPPIRRFLHPKGLYDEELAAFKDMSVDEIIVTLLDSVHARLREVPFEELLGYFAKHNAPAVYAFMIDYDKLVESIQERVEKDSDLKLLFESTVKVLQTREEPVAAFLGKIIDFAIDSSQRANFWRRHLQTLREDERGPRFTIKRSLVPECTVQSSHMNALKSDLLDKKPDDIKSFIAEILVKESQFAKDEMTPSTDTLRWVWSLHVGDSTQRPQAIKIIVETLSTPNVPVRHHIEPILRCLLPTTRKALI